MFITRSKHLRPGPLPIVRRLVVVVAVILVVAVMADLAVFVDDDADHAAPDVIEAFSENPKRLAVGLAQDAHKHHSVGIVAEDQGVGKPRGRGAVYYDPVVALIHFGYERTHAVRGKKLGGVWRDRTGKDRAEVGVACFLDDIFAHPGEVIAEAPSPGQ